MSGEPVIVATNASTRKGNTVNNFNSSALATAIGLAFSVGAMAQTMSEDQYKSGREGIAAEFKSAKTACGFLAGNAKDICMARASGREQVARAEIEARFKPSENASYNVRIAKADADYSVAMERCDDSAGNVKDVCVKEAKATAVGARADALVQKTTAEANEAASKKSAKAQNAAGDSKSRARNEANEKSAEARRVAAAEKRDADYAVAKQKCDAFAGGAKDDCMNEAKARFGKA